MIMFQHTGKKFHFLNPHPDEIDLEDIIHALSLICRYNGAVKHHYSVLSHSINVCTYVYERQIVTNKHWLHCVTTFQKHISGYS